MTRFSLFASVAVLVVSAAGIRDAAAQAPGNKVDAKSLMQSGLKLFEAKDFLGALAVFKNAYAQFPSARILLNIGTTQIQLDRKADAANSYQKYLDSADADPAKKADVTTELATLDQASGLLELSITPDDSEVLLGDDWVSAKSVHLWRVAPGMYAVKVRRAGFEPAEKSDSIAAGGKTAVTIALVAIPETVKQVIVTVPRDVVPEGPRSRIGALALAHVSVVPKIGSAVFVGATADLTDQLSVDAALILGPGIVDSMGSATLPPPKLGVYPGASFAFMTGDLRPRISAGFPIFFDSGARVFVRGAGGIEYLVSRRLAFILDVGAEVAFSKASDIHEFALVPSLGVTGRL